MINDLPHIDTHGIDLDVEPEVVWRALVGSFGSAGGKAFVLYARLIGVEPDRAEGSLDRVGSTRVGFRVAEAEEPVRLLLSGRHRFSNYALTWRISEPDAGQSRLEAITNAEFPGLHGRVYKALVIDSGAHAQVTRRMLSTVARRAKSEKGAD